MAWVWCQGCGEQVPVKLAKRARHDRSFAVCFGCLRRWEAEGQLCTWCNTQIAKVHTLAFTPERQRLKALHYMRCPKCGAELVAIAYHGIELDKCTACQGV